MACGAMFESVEALIRRRNRVRADGVFPPFQLQVLESDYLDVSKTEPTSSGYIIQGVEFDRVGRRVGYWLYGQHPGDPVNTGVRGGLGLQSAFVPADQIIHLYEPTRPGQVRGVPELSAVMMAMRDLDDWEDSEIIRKKTESCLAAIVRGPAGENRPF